MREPETGPADGKLELIAESRTKRQGRPATVYRIKQLIRGDDAKVRSAVASGRLLRIVSAWGPRTSLDVTLGALGRRGNAGTFAIRGSVPNSWVADLKWALRDVAEIEPTSQQSDVAPGYVAEFEPARGPVVVDGFVDPDEGGRELAYDWFARQQVAREATPWPQPMYADLGELLGLNVASGTDRLDLVLRYRLSASSALEREMLTDGFHDAWDPALGSAHEYIGTPIRVRALIGSNCGALPGRVQAIIGQWSSFVDLTPLQPEDAESAWSGDPLSLAGRAMPHGAALALVRLPAAGYRAFPGMRTTEAPVLSVPLDPLPAKPADSVRIGRAKTAIGTWTDVCLGLRDLTQHVFVQGMSGSGKSTLLSALAIGILRAGGSFTLLDPEGSTVDAVLRRVTADQADAIRVIRHGDPRLNVPINLLAGSSAKLERMVALFAEMIQRAQDPKQTGMVGPRWTRYFTLIALNAVALLGEDATLIAVAKIAGDPARVRALAEATQEIAPEHSRALRNEYAALADKELYEIASWGASKFQELLASDAIRWILGAGPDPIDVTAAMDSGTSLLVDLGAHELGQPAGRAIGATYLLKHWAALGDRQRRDRFHVLMIDEAHLFSYGPLPRLLAEARKFGVGVVVATQHLGQLTGELADAVESNTSTFISLRSGLESAQRASVRLMGWRPESLVRLPNLTAAMTMSRDGLVTTPFTVHLDHHAQMRTLARKGLVGEDVAASIVAQSHDELARSYADLHPMTDSDLRKRLTTPVPPPGELDQWLARRRRTSSRRSIQPSSPARSTDGAD